MSVSFATMRLRLRLNPSWETDWEVSDPHLIADMEFTEGGDFFSGSAGVITAAQALTTVRSTSNSLAEDEDGLLMSFPANTPRISNGRGYWGETSSTSRTNNNGDLAVVEEWALTNCTITKDLPSPFAAGSGFESVPGCCINVTANGDATVLQTMPPFTGADEVHPHGRFYLISTSPLHGDVEITQDGVVWTAVTPYLVTNRWKQIGGAVQTVTLLDQVLGVRMKDALAGDKLGVMLLSPERGYLMSTSIYTPTTATVNRSQDVTEMVLSSFPTIWDKTQLTVFVVMRPWQLPLPGKTDTAHPRRGGTVLEINNPYNIVGTGIGSLAPYGGAGEGSLMTLASVSSGSFSVGNRIPIGTGVGSYTDITSQESGTPGGAGTYRVFSTLYPDGQTLTDIDIQARTKTAQGLGLNWAQKPDDEDEPGVVRIGLTVTSEPDMTDFGNDPVNGLLLNEVNCLGYTIDLANRTGFVALNGGTQALNPVQYTHSPVFTSDLVVTVGSQYPQGGSLGGEVKRIIISGRYASEAEMAAATLSLKNTYTT